MSAEVIKVNYDWSVRVLDRITIVTPLGLRFQDAMTGEAVRDGLVVSAYPTNRPNARRSLITNRRGVYVLQNASALRDLQNGAGDAAYWDNLPATKDFVVEVTDQQARFIPFQFVVGLPVQWNKPASSPPSIKDVALYSAPTRTVPAGMATVRADLWDPTAGANGGSAASAVLEFYDDGAMVARGVADQQGRIAVLFPYPAPRSFPVTSPPGSPPVNRPALTDQTWTFQARALYASAIQSPLEPLSEISLPDLQSVLTQPEATLWADEARTEELQEVAVQFGCEKVLRSKSSSASPPNRDLPLLFITPAV
jgi:hypothetical protein